MHLTVKVRAQDPLAGTVAQDVRHSIRRPERTGPILAEAVAAERVKVVGGFSDITIGRVAVL
ncbi:hypothetical protein R1A27_06575 [Methylobacterium sp. NMS12]|uniref:hypothetical protein n=1 Tax=Methylobacterium sp. NMS12 TaxID=3079766 RepID=UPI003F8859C8